MKMMKNKFSYKIIKINLKKVYSPPLARDRIVIKLDNMLGHELFCLFSSREGYRDLENNLAFLVSEAPHLERNNIVVSHKHFS